MSENKKLDKDAMKNLRAERRAWVENAQKSIKSQSQIIKQIKGQISDTAKTIPDIAQATGMPTAQVSLYIAGLKKYGEVVEAEKDGDYFKYGLAS